MSLREWDRLPLDERDLRLAEHDRKRLECPSCGNSVADCSDPERVWYPYRRVCYATMERESSQALYADLHDKAQFHDGTHTNWSSKRSRKFPVRFDEGVQIGVAAENLTPWDEFTTKADASPLPPTDQGESPPDADEAVN